MTVHLLLLQQTRNVVTLSLTNIYTKKDVPHKIKKLFTDVPYYKYDSKTKTIKVKIRVVKAIYNFNGGTSYSKTLKFIFNEMDYESILIDKR